MEKKCLYCGNPFIANKSFQKYCSKNCNNHARWNTTRSEQKKKAIQDAEIVINLYESDLSVKEIAERVNRTTSFIYETWHDAGLPKRMTLFQKEVLKLRQEGLCSVEIAIRLNITDQKKINNLRVTAKAVGFPFTEEEIQRSVMLGQQRSIQTRYGTAVERINVSSEFIIKNYSNWEYISGFIGSDDFLTLKCKKCGTVVEKSAVTVRHKREIICKTCHVIDGIQREKEHKEQIEKNRKEREFLKMETFLDKAGEQMSFRQCVLCSGLFFPTNDRIKTCSEKCQRAYTNRHRGDKRLRKIKNGLVDNDITLQKLYKRDSGTCWICGKQCDYNDYELSEDGFFIVRANYPSIDHVMPLSRGGLHSWDNVKLAHHYCNTLKNDKVVSMA